LNQEEIRNQAEEWISTWNAHDLDAIMIHADKPIYGIVGGLHLYGATDEVADWAAPKLLEFHVANLLAAHCTGIEATSRLRQDLGLSRKTAVIASARSSFSLADGIEAGPLPNNRAS
jgi:7,8-dihydropterin-6-yl-methyl-4-(beta-D-ribofuranosyl)aminobenzene 5'-phosphate synthase